MSIFSDFYQLKMVSKSVIFYQLLGVLKLCRFYHQKSAQKRVKNRGGIPRGMDRISGCVVRICAHFLHTCFIYVSMLVRAEMLSFVHTNLHTFSGVLNGKL